MDRDPFDLVGATLDGRFIVEALAGRGDLSVVYRGHHLAVDEPVAIKCLDLPATLDGALVRPLVESFREGSRLHTRLARGHRGIAQSFAIGSTLAPATGMIVPYLVREWFEGESLSADLARRRAEGKKGRTLEEVVALLQPAVEAISYAHSQSSPHLSLNPSRLFLADRGGKRILRVLDFGIARAMNDLARAIPPGSRPAVLRAVFPAYGAPEQVDTPAGETGARTDVYAIAIMVMELLSDRAVMRSSTEAQGNVGLEEQGVSPPPLHGLELPESLDKALRRAVAQDPGRRQKDAAELWKDVTASLRGSRARPSRSTQPPSVAGAVPGRRWTVPVGPSTPTLPMGFDPGLFGGMPVPLRSTAGIEPEPDPSSAHVVASPPPRRAATPDLPPVMVADDSPPAAPALPRGPADLSPPRTRVQSPTFPTFKERPAGRRPGSVLALVLAGVIGASLGAGLVVSFKRQMAARASVGPVPAASLDSPPPPASAPPSPPASTPGADNASRLPAPLASHFPAAAARRALDGASHAIVHCKLGKRWGVATAIVAFGKDGSVSQVGVGIPFTGTATGRCVSEALARAQVAPFAGKPGLLAYRFFVPPQ